MKNTISTWLIYALPSLLTTSLAYAVPQESAPLPEEEYFADIPIVLTATRLAQPVNEAPASMTIIDRQLIEASGARNIADVFKIIPGFQVQYENGHTPIVTYHGMSDQFSRWLQVLVDGRTIYNPATGGVEWSQLPLVLDEIERIEVTRGPNAASFGSNAFSATINIITKHASETTGTFFRLTAGNPDNVRDAILRYGESTENLDYRIMLGRLTDDGFSERHDINRANLGRLRMDFNPDTKNTWLFEAGFNNGPRGLDFGNNYDNPERNREKEVENSFQQLRWTHNLSNKEELYIQYFHNHQKINEINEYDLTAREFGIDPADTATTAFYNLDPVHFALYNSLKTNRHDLEIQHTLVPNDDWRIVWGGSMRRDQWYAPGLISNKGTFDIDLFRIFANTEWKVTNDFTINAGTMQENSDLTGNSISPRLGVLYRINNNHNFRAVTSKATRIPIMIEYDGEIIIEYTGQNLTTLAGFPDPSYDSFLRSTKKINYETITSFEIGLNSHNSNTTFSTDVKIYQDKITDTIFFDTAIDPLNDIPGTPMGTPDNGENITIQGIEFQADIRPYKNSRIFMGYARTNIISDDINLNYSKTTPENSFSLLFLHRFKNKINASFSFYRSSEYRGLGSGDQVDTQSRADIRLSIPFKKNNFRGDVSFISKNISGTEYFDWDRNSHYKRTNLVTLSGQFN